MGNRTEYFLTSFDGDSVGTFVGFAVTGLRVGLGVAQSTDNLNVPSAELKPLSSQARKQSVKISLVTKSYTHHTVKVTY